MRMIYLDNAATTKIDPRVLDDMLPYLKDEFGNPGSLYPLGRRAKIAVEAARGNVAQFINCEPDQVLFTSGGTESNNTVFKSTAKYLLQHGKRHIVTSKTEHDSVLRSAKCAQERYGFDVTFLDVDSKGCISPEKLVEALRDDTGLVSIMYTNNETGAVNPVESIGEVCRERGILFHTDCVQAAGFYPLDVEKIQCDFLSMSSHKIHGAKGVGALYVRDRSMLEPLIVGGRAQEFGLRGGTENVAGIVGFGRACYYIMNYPAGAGNYIKRLSEVFVAELRSRLRDKRLENILHINGDEINIGKTISMRFDNVDGETLLLMLASKEIYLSAGSACRSLESEPSHVLTAIGLTPDEARDSVRVSFSTMNGLWEMDAAAREIADCVEFLYRQFENNSQRG